MRALRSKIIAQISSERRKIFFVLHIYCIWTRQEGRQALMKRNDMFSIIFHFTEYLINQIEDYRLVITHRVALLKEEEKTSGCFFRSWLTCKHCVFSSKQAIRWTLKSFEISNGRGLFCYLNFIVQQKFYKSPKNGLQPHDIVL